MINKGQCILKVRDIILMKPDLKKKNIYFLKTGKLTSLWPIRHMSVIMKVIVARNQLKKTIESVRPLEVRWFA